MAVFIHPNQCLIFFRDPDAAFTPARLVQAFAGTIVKADGEAEPIGLRCDDGSTLYASIVRGEVAAILATRLMGRGRKYRALAAASDSYIEFKFESLDEVLDDINTLIEVQATLQAATGGLMYRAWNQSFMGPDE